MAILGALGLGGCAAPQRRASLADAVRHDFVAEAPLADAGSETPRIDLAAPGARAPLIRGWSKAEPPGPGSEPFTWSLGRVSLLEFYLSEPRDLTLELRGFPFDDTLRPPVAVRVNSRAAGTIATEPGWRTYRLPVSAGLLAGGTNRLELEYGFTHVPARRQRDSNDVRELAMGWSWVGLSPLDVDGPSEQPSADPRSGTLRLPAGTRLDFYLEIEAEQRITFDELRLYGEPGCRLRLGMQPDPGPPRALAEFGEAASGASVPIPATARGLARLTFATVCPGGRAGGVILWGPVLRGGATDSGPRPPLGASPVGDPSTPRARPPVIVYLVDSLRADHLGCYGYPKPVSPHIDAFARDAWLYTRARSHTSWTRPAVASLFTGLEPGAHGVRGDRDGLGGDAPTLARILKAAGYRTGAVVTNGNVGRAFGFATGFDFFSEDEQTADEVNRAAARWLDEAGREAPVFLYLHAVEPHEPYDPPAAFRRRFATDVRTPGTGSEEHLDALSVSSRPPAAHVRQELRDLYDAEIAASDAAFGELTALLRSRRLYDDALIVFCADHGEELGEHGAWRHGHTLHRELLEIPLIVKRPGAVPGSGRRVDGIVQLSGIYSLILEELGLASGGTRPGPGPAFFSLDRGAHRALGVQDGRWKLIRESGTEARTQLFDLEQDPAEAHDLYDSRPVRAKYLLGLLRARQRAVRRSLTAGTVTPDPALRERLRAIGYVE